VANKDILAEKALQEIPRILSLIDKNKFSPTYGCFDRNYWNYRTVDFPTGMAQLGTLPLAQVYAHQFPNNPYYKQERIKELAIAGMRYLKKCSHKDGTTDEFYPFERALGATSFSLTACCEAYLLLNEDLPDVVAFFKKRADWMMKYSEPNVIANHQAGVALALARVYQITKEEKYLKGAKQRIRELDQWWQEEGWFFEYEGCDPGYATFTITFLARYYDITKDEHVLPFLKKSIEFCTYFIAPDGSYGGEYGSRNTGHFYPHGFELAGEDNGLMLVDAYLEGIEAGKNEFMNDEKYFFYNVINYLDAWLVYNKSRPPKKEKEDFEKHFEKAQLYVVKKGPYFVVISFAKGTLRVYKDKQLVYNDAGFIGKLKDGTIITSQIISGHKTTENSVQGHFHKVKFKLPSPVNMMVFRTLLLAFAWNWKVGSKVKDLLVKMLITGKNEVPVTFERSFSVTEKGVVVKNILKSKERIEEMYLGTDHAVITVPTSKYFQESAFLPWQNLQDKCKELNEKGVVEFTQHV
tara:strand:+ start:1615 stop:3180 length:1566 start_codon:yes stop_codon:yes gene_type:complete